MLEEKTFDTGEVIINYAESPPAGPPMVLLHGGGDRWQGFLPLIPNLVLRRQVYALDLRGHGKSGRVPGGYRPENYVKDVIAFFNRHCKEPAGLFCHSLGGWIALLTAAQQKTGIEGLILGDPPLNLEKFLQFEGSEARIKMWRGMQRLAAIKDDLPKLTKAIAEMPADENDHGAALQYIDLPGVDAVSCREMATTLNQVDPEAVRYHAEGRLDEYVQQVNFERALPQITCPTLLLQGDPQHGGILSDRDVEKILPKLIDGVHVKIDGFGHNLGLSSWNVAQVQRAVTLFLESL